VADRAPEGKAPRKAGWVVDDVPTALRDRAAAAAVFRGVSLGAWLCNAITLAIENELGLGKQREWLREVVTAAEGHPILTPREARFVHDIRVKYVEGPDYRRISDRQAEVMRRIQRKVEPEPDAAWEDAQWARVDLGEDSDDEVG
jgi:hypothetical protein